MKVFALPQLSLLALWLTVLFAGNAQASWREAVPGAQLLGSAEYSLFGFSLYRARLWSPQRALSAEQPFALELTYHRSITQEDLVAASLKEMRQVAAPKVSEQQLTLWAAQMQLAFADVQPGQSITGVFLPGQGASFYFGPQLKHEIRDSDFANAFFAIWLAPNTREPQLREQLLGQAEAD